MQACQESLICFNCIESIQTGRSYLYSGQQIIDRLHNLYIYIFFVFLFCLLYYPLDLHPPPKSHVQKRQTEAASLNRVKFKYVY